jgi:hypothetical protein
MSLVAYICNLIYIDTFVKNRRGLFFFVFYICENISNII